MGPHKGPGGEATKELNLDIILATTGTAGHAETEPK